jgi:hypothetical protein
MPSRDACVKRSKVLLKDRSKAQVLVEGLHNGLIKIREYFVRVNICNQLN